MENIVKTTTYWLLKPITEGEVRSNSHWYIRMLPQHDKAEYKWIIGRKNTLGLISPIASYISPVKEAELEQEFQQLVSQYNNTLSR